MMSAIVKFFSEKRLCVYVCLQRKKEKTAVGLGRPRALEKRAEQVPDAINQTVGSKSKPGSKLQLQLHQRPGPALCSDSQ